MTKVERTLKLTIYFKTLIRKNKNQMMKLKKKRLNRKKSLIRQLLKMKRKLMMFWTQKNTRRCFKRGLLLAASLSSHQFQNTLLKDV